MAKAVSTIHDNGRMTTMCIPKVIVNKLQIKKGDRVYMEVKEDGTLIIKK